MIDGRSYNLGYVQSRPQMVEDGSISIVYLNGDRCGSTSYSTRLIFQCDDHPVSTAGLGSRFFCLTGKQKTQTSADWRCVRPQGSPLFDRKDGCEYVFVWRTSEACPVRKSQGEPLPHQGSHC